MFDLPAGISIRLYLLLLAAVAIARALELRVSLRNERWLARQGGVEVGRAHYRWMIVLHASFLVACALEVLWLRRTAWAPLTTSMLVVLVVASVLRYWVIATLGRRWTTRVIVLPGAPPVSSGPFRWLRHPNYLAVVLEFVALPLVHGAWATAILWSVANAWVLRTRIRVEEAALDQSGDYQRAFADRPAFVPRVR